MINLIHCALTYHSHGDDALTTFSIGVKKLMFENAALFTARPISDADLGTLIENHSNTYVAYKMGGVNQQPAYNTAHLALITGLDSIADFINGLVKNNQTQANVIIVSGGFVPTKAGSTSVPVPAIPTNNTLDRGDIQEHGVINTTTPAVPGATFYGCVASENAPLDPNSFINGQLIINAANPNKVRMDVNKSRKKTFTALTSGVNYYFQFYAGNANGISALSTAINISAV